MRNTFVKSIGNVKAMSAALAELMAQRSDVGMALALGEKGLGKSRTAISFVAQEPERLVFVRAKCEWTTRWMLRDLITELGFIPARGVEAAFRQLVDILRDNPGMIILVDEVDMVCRRPSIVQTLRDVFDLTETPIMLIGLPETELALKNFGPLLDRVTHIVRFRKLSAQDVQAAVTELAEVEFSSEAALELHQHIEPRMRAVRRAVLDIEASARVMSWNRIEPEHIRAWKHKGRTKGKVARLSAARAEVVNG